MLRTLARFFAIQAERCLGTLVVGLGMSQFFQMLLEQLRPQIYYLKPFLSQY